MTLRPTPEFLSGSGVETTPCLIPAESEVVFESDVWLEEITLTNRSDGGVSVTVADRQEAPLEILPAVYIPGHSYYGVRFGARFCPGGCTWVASAADAVVGYLRGRR